jgi:diguanylate cyclase (GGDEF)-like protein
VDATRVMERLRAEVEERMRSFDWPITCSVGVVTSAGTGVAAEVLLRRADELMYRVKESGKNSLLQAVLPSG